MNEENYKRDGQTDRKKVHRTPLVILFKGRVGREETDTGGGGSHWIRKGIKRGETE